MLALPPVFWLVLGLLVCAEVAILVPVIVTVRAQNAASAEAQLQSLTDDFAVRVNQTVSIFVYNVVRAAAAVPRSSFMSQQDLVDLLQLQADPRNTPALLYFWVPLVQPSQRQAFVQFYGFNITQLSPGNVLPVVPEPLNTSSPAAPYCVFAPALPATANPAVYGFDLLSYGPTVVDFRNESQYLIIPSGLITRTQNDYGFVAVAFNQFNRGWMFGRAGSGDLLDFSLTVPRQAVTLAAYVVSASNATRQALHYDNTPDLVNATTVAAFNASPDRASFYTASFVTLNQTIMVAVKYDPSFAQQYQGNTWVILAAVLPPVCFLIDVIVVVLALLFQRQRQLHLLEAEHKRSAHLMLGYVNHEIRNPLQTIMGLAEIRRDMLVEEEDEQKDNALVSDLSTIIRAAEFIERIASDILDVRRIEEGRIQIEMVDVNVRLLLSSVEKTVTPLLAEKPDVQFLVDCDSELVTIRTDRYRLEQIILNFLSNAFKHTEKGQVKLSLRIVNNGKMVEIRVMDTGHGIEEDVKAKLFEQFSQASSKDASDFGGFGLGLYLSKMLARLLGGQIGFESELGVGSSFWVLLPFELANVSVQFDETAIVLINKR